MIQLLGGPVGGFGYDGVGIVLQSSAAGSSDGSLELPIAIKHVSNEAVSSYPFDRRAGKHRSELAVVQGGQCCQERRGQIVPADELLMRRRLGELVPRTNCEAIIAAIDSVADRFPKIVGNRAFVFDRQVGNAAGCVELIRCREGVSWADIRQREHEPQ